MTSQIAPPPIAVEKEMNLPKNPPVKGMPISEARKKISRLPSSGER